MQKIKIIGFFFKNWLHWQSEVEKKILHAAVLGYIYILRTNRTLIHNSLEALEHLGKNLSHKEM
jgi:hypothetical protein